jgi:hypothetical protein
LGFILWKERNLLNQEVRKLPIVGCKAKEFFEDTKDRKSLFLLNGKPCDNLNYRFRSGDIVDVVSRPAGGDSLPNFFEIALIAVGVALLFVPGFEAAGYGLITSGAGQYLGRLLTPSSRTKPSDKAKDRKSELTGSSNENAKDILPFVFGKTQITPPYLQSPHRLVGEGNAFNKFRFYFGLPGNVTTSKDKLGEALLSSYNPAYSNIEKQNGGDFIGFDNIKEVVKDEALITNQGVQEFNKYRKEYNIQGNTTSGLNLNDIVIRYDNLILSEFTNINFGVLVRYESTFGQDITTSSNFIVTSGDLLFISGETYESTNSIFFNIGHIKIKYIEIYPISNTKLQEQNDTTTLKSFEIPELSSIETPEANIDKYDVENIPTIETSPLDTTDVILNFAFPQGFYKLIDNKKKNRSVNISVKYRAVGDTIFKNISTADTVYTLDINGLKQLVPNANSTTVVSDDIVTMQSPDNLNNSDNLFFRTIGFSLSAGQYEVQLENTSGEKGDSDIGEVVIADFKFVIEGQAVNQNIVEKISQTRLEIQANKTLSGTVSQYNVIAEAKIPYWNGTGWINTKVSRNPAAIVRALLTSDIYNPRAESEDRLDNDSFVEFYNFCEEQGYQCDGVISDFRKILDIITTILDNFRGELTIRNGLYYIGIDQEKDYAELFTPHNTYKMNWNLGIGVTTDAMKVKYVDETDYKEKEVIGYYINGDVVFETEIDDSEFKISTKDLEFVQNLDDVKKIISFELRSIQERRMGFDFGVNMEALNRSLLDRVYIANNNDMINEYSGRISELLIDGANIIGFRFDFPVDIKEVGYYMTIRSFETIDSENSKPLIAQYEIDTNNNTKEVYLTNPILHSNIIKGKGKMQDGKIKWQYDGDLFDIGKGKIYSAIISNIRPNDDNTATITALETSEEFYNNLEGE